MLNFSLKNPTLISISSQFRLFFLDTIEDMTTTMDRLQKELDNLDQARQDLSHPQPYTTQTISSASLYSTQPKKFAPVTAPKPKAKTGGYGGSSLPPPGPHSSRGEDGFSRSLLQKKNALLGREWSALCL